MINFRTKRQTIEDIQRVLINCVGIQATLTCLLQHQETKLLEYGTPEVNVGYIRVIRISTSSEVRFKVSDELSKTGRSFHYCNTE